MKKKPIVGITMGDPFGNGAEVTAKALNYCEIYNVCRPVVIGDQCCMERALQTVKKTTGAHLVLHVIRNIDDAKFQYGTIDIMNLGLVSDKSLPDFKSDEQPKPYGIGPCKEGGEAAFQYVKKVIELAMDGQVDATVTNAISKEAINMAGHHFSGHTEIYAYYTNTKKYAMMLAHEDLRVIHVSTHVSLREACNRVKRERVLDCIRMGNEACKALGITTPKIAVAGLNPHCGENGMFGTEEKEEIQPAIDEALLEGICIPDKKPVPPDSVFSKAIGGWYDIVVAMYHDQGHIPLKVKGFVFNREKKQWDAVAGINVTLGIPIIRVSVDHGTGYDMAGNGLSNELSLVNSIEAAVQMANYKNA